MLQRILHFAQANYGLAVFWAYLAAFGVAFLSIFVFPPAALGLVLLSLLLLVPVAIVGSVLRAAARAASRPYLRRGVCPQCRSALAEQAPGACACSACGAQYGPKGELQQAG